MKTIWGWTEGREREAREAGEGRWHRMIQPLAWRGKAKLKQA